MAAGVNNLKPFSLDEMKPKQTWSLGLTTLTLYGYVNNFSLDEVKPKQTWRLRLTNLTLLLFSLDPQKWRLVLIT